MALWIAFPPGLYMVKNSREFLSDIRAFIAGLCVVLLFIFMAVGYGVAWLVMIMLAAVSDIEDRQFPVATLLLVTLFIALHFGLFRRSRKERKETAEEKRKREQEERDRQDDADDDFVISSKKFAANDSVGPAGGRRSDGGVDAEDSDSTHD